MRKGFGYLTAGVAILVIAGQARALDQGTAANPANQDVLPALLTEVRALRAAMEQMASAGPRIQLAMGRLQLQEQRINTLLRRLDEIRDRIASAERDEAAQRERIAQLEGARQRIADPGERQALEELLPGVKTRAAAGAAEIQRLRTEEGTLIGTVGSEQGRWAEINQRLEELDRALTRR